MLLHTQGQDAACLFALHGTWHSKMRMGALKEDTERGIYHHHLIASHTAAGTKGPQGTAEEALRSKVRWIPREGTK